MILPIYAYGTEALREETEPVQENSEELQELIDNMIETMHAAAGIGLAAPQVGRTERLFVVDATPMAEEIEAEGETLPPQPMVFINPEITWESEGEVDFEEGCLSIPEVREVVTRPERIQIAYRDREFRKQEREVGSVLARVIQHEFDHLEGVLFVDHLSAFRKRLLKRSLREIARGDLDADYLMRTRDEEKAHA
jgi:peptide deformylase